MSRFRKICNVLVLLAAVVGCGSMTNLDGEVTREVSIRLVNADNLLPITILAPGETFGPSMVLAPNGGTRVLEWEVTNHEELVFRAGRDGEEFLSARCQIAWLQNGSGALQDVTVSWTDAPRGLGCINWTQ